MGDQDHQGVHGLSPPIIGRRCHYMGTHHRFARRPGVIVVIVAVHRGDDILEDDTLIGTLAAGDVVEWAPVIVEDGRERLSFVTSDADPSELTRAD